MKHDESNLIEPEKIFEIVQSDPLWYLQPGVSRTIDTYVLADTKGHDEEWKNERKRIVETFATLLKEGAVLLRKFTRRF